MVVTQLNISYALSEDRLLFRLTSKDDQEFRFWLTRKIALDLLKKIEEILPFIVDRKNTDQDIKNSKKDITVSKNNSAKQTKLKVFEPARQLPLGPEPVLVIGVDIMLKADSKDSTLIKLSLANQQHLTIPSNEYLLNQIQLLLEHGYQKAQWGTPPADKGEVTDQDILKSVTHEIIDRSTLH